MQLSNNPSSDRMSSVCAEVRAHVAAAGSIVTKTITG